MTLKDMPVPPGTIETFGDSRLTYGFASDGDCALRTAVPIASFHRFDGRRLGVLKGTAAATEEILAHCQRPQTRHLLPERRRFRAVL
jgi:hypothetical protein